MSPIKVVIADCNQMYRTGIRSVLSQHEGIMVSGEVTTPEELARISSSTDKPDVLVANFAFSSTNCLEMLEKFVSENPSIPVVAIGTLSEEAYAARVLRAGGAAYLKADCSGADLIEAVLVVKSGRMYLTSKASTAVIEQLQNRNIEKIPHSCLSDREYQIFNMICRGTPLVRIGESFGISVKTVSTYRSRILKKMNMQTNAELIQYAVKNQIVESMSA